MNAEARVLKVLDYLLGDDLCADVEMQLASKELKTKLEKDLALKLGLLYRIVHSHVKSSVCWHVHEDWRKEFLKIEKEMEKVLTRR